MADLSSLEKGLLILRELAVSDGGMTVAELAQATGLNRTTTYRLCDTLEEDGWVLRVGGEESVARLDVGPALHGLAVLIGSKYDSEEKLRPIIEGLARSLDETVHVGILDHAQLIHVARALPDAGLNMAARIGHREPAHVAALGKALLATLSNEELDRLYLEESLPIRTEKTISSRTELFRDLERIRAVGYAVDDEESRVGVKCIAAPVFGPTGRGIFAVSVTTMPVRLSGERFDQVVTAVQAAASLTTAAFGGRTPQAWSKQEAAA